MNRPYARRCRAGVSFSVNRPCGSVNGQDRRLEVIVRRNAARFSKDVRATFRMTTRNPPTDLERSLRTTFIVALCGLALALATTAFVSVVTTRNADAAGRSREIARMARDVLSLMKDRETGI